MGRGKISWADEILAPRDWSKHWRILWSLSTPRVAYLRVCYGWREQIHRFSTADYSSSNDWEWMNYIQLICISLCDYRIYIFCPVSIGSWFLHSGLWSKGVPCSHSRLVWLLQDHWRVDSHAFLASFLCWSRPCSFTPRLIPRQTTFRVCFHDLITSLVSRLAFESRSAGIFVGMRRPPRPIVNSFDTAHTASSARASLLGNAFDHR